MHDADDYIRSYGKPRQYELARGDVSELVGNVGTRTKKSATIRTAEGTTLGRKPGEGDALYTNLNEGNDERRGPGTVMQVDPRVS